MRPWHELTSLPVQQVNKRAQNKTCSDCGNFEPCPDFACDWGLCRAELDRWDGGNIAAWVKADDAADECKDYEEDK